MISKNFKKFIPVIVYFIFVLSSFATGFDAGKKIGMNFAVFSLELLKVLPPAFILIGLFEVWGKSATIQNHLGSASGFKGYIWALLLSATTIGGLYVAFPVSYSLYSKGAKLSVMFTYLSASAICRVPMTIFEASFLGLKFSIIRFLVSLPLVIITSMALGSYLEKTNYKIRGGLK